MADTQQAPKPAKRENVFTRKIGPLPMWGWVGIVGGGVLVYAIWANKNNSQQQPPPGNTAAPLVITTPPEQDDDDDDKKGPAHHHKRHKPRSHPGHGGGPPEDEPKKDEGSFTTNRAATLQQVANARHWTPGMLAHVEQEDHLKASSKLRKGQRIKVPWER